MAAAAANRLSGCDWAFGSVLAQADRPPDVNVDNFSVLCRAFFAGDLFHRLQAARRGIGMERVAPGGCAAQGGRSRAARTHLRLGLFALESKISAREPAEICHCARGVRRHLERGAVEREGYG